MDWSACEIVEVIPGKVGGIPLIRGTRMPAEQGIESLDLGETGGEIATTTTSILPTFGDYRLIETATSPHCNIENTF